MSELDGSLKSKALDLGEKVTEVTTPLLAVLAGMEVIGLNMVSSLSPHALIALCAGSWLAHHKLTQIHRT